MSINDATPEEWDALKADRYYENRPFPEPECTLIKPSPVPEMPESNFDWDAVNKPPHYRVGEVEAIAYIEQQLGTGVRDYLLGNVHKYLHRHRFKGQLLSDLKKAQWYLTKLIMEEEQQ